MFLREFTVLYHVGQTDWLSFRVSYLRFKCIINDPSYPNNSACRETRNLERCLARAAFFLTYGLVVLELAVLFLVRVSHCHSKGTQEVSNMRAVVPRLELGLGQRIIPSTRSPLTMKIRGGAANSLPIQHNANLMRQRNDW